MDATVNAPAAQDVAKTNALKTFGVNFIIAFAANSSYSVLSPTNRPILVGASIGAIAGRTISSNQANPIIGTLIGAGIGAAVGYALRNNETIQPIFQNN